MKNYYDHGEEQVCVCCGLVIPQHEHESCSAEKTKQGFVCWLCQNQKSPETLAKYGPFLDE